VGSLRVVGAASRQCIQVLDCQLRIARDLVRQDADFLTCAMALILIEYGAQRDNDPAVGQELVASGYHMGQSPLRRRCRHDDHDGGDIMA
jgi:hypothetical protein